MASQESDTTEQLSNNNKTLKEFSSFLGDFFLTGAANPPAHSHAFPGVEAFSQIHSD